MPPSCPYFDEFLRGEEKRRRLLERGTRDQEYAEVAVARQLRETGLRMIAARDRDFDVVEGEQLWVECNVPGCVCTYAASTATRVTELPKPSGLLVVIRCPYLDFCSYIEAVSASCGTPIALSQACTSTYRMQSPSLRRRWRQRDKDDWDCVASVPAQRRAVVAPSALLRPPPTFTGGLRLSRKRKGRWPTTEEQLEGGVGESFTHFLSHTSPRNLEHSSRYLAVVFHRRSDGGPAPDWTEKDSIAWTTEDKKRRDAQFEQRDGDDGWPDRAITLVIVVGGLVKHRGSGNLQVSTPVLVLPRICTVRPETSAGHDGKMRMVERHSLRHPGSAGALSVVTSCGAWSLRSL